MLTVYKTKTSTTTLKVKTVLALIITLLDMNLFQQHLSTDKLK